MIGIIGALDVEVNSFSELIENKKCETVSGIKFICGEFLGKDVVIAISGVGKVNAALTTEAMIIKYSPEYIINTGIAGSLTDRLKIGDVAISSALVEHDMNTTSLGELRGYISGIEKVFIDADKSISEKFSSVLNELNINFEVGVLASGDIFVTSQKHKDKISSEFGAICCEMEGASIAHVAAANNVPVCVIRVISDSANDDSPMSYPKFKMLAASRSTDILKSYFSKLD